MALLALASVGLWAGFFGPIQVLLAQQAEALDAANKEQVLALVTGLGALVSVICNPLAGAFSDRTTLRAGRRLPWLVGGAARRGGLARGPVGRADSVAVMVLGWCGVQAALNAMLAAVTAMIPDQVPVSRRGRIGGIVAVAQTIGVVGRHRHRGGDRQHRGRLPGHRGVPAGAGGPVLLRSRDLALPRRAAAAVRPAPVPALVLDLAAGASRTSRWAWLTRFLVNLGNALGLLYLLYFLQDVDRLQLRRGGEPGLRAHRDLRRSPWC